MLLISKACRFATSLSILFTKSIEDNDVTHRKIFTISKILAIFIFLNMANLLLINNYVISRF